MWVVCGDENFEFWDFGGFFGNGDGEGAVGDGVVGEGF